MAAPWTINRLSKKTKVPAGTLRYWERLGLLPRAFRTHTGYRVFAGEVLQYVEFVRRSKAMGLSLRQMQTSAQGRAHRRSPCPEVEQWIRARLVKVEEQIRELRALEQRLLVLSRGFCDRAVNGVRSPGLCSLIVGLPEEAKFRKPHADEPACFGNHSERRETSNVHTQKRSR